MRKTLRKRRLIVVLTLSVLLFAAGLTELQSQVAVETPQPNEPKSSQAQASQDLALASLSYLDIKGRAPKTGYSRERFSSGWDELGQCDTRNRLLARDLAKPGFGDDNCVVLSGTLHDPYTGRIIEFVRGENSQDVHVDHVVALSDAWQKGAQKLSSDRRRDFYHDDLNLLVTDGQINIQKGSSDAASWLPPNKPFRCQFVARQIAVKVEYNLWITQAEHDAKSRVLQKCPGQRLPSP